MPAGPELVLSKQVTIALGELAGAREGLLTRSEDGLGVLDSLLDV